MENCYTYLKKTIGIRIFHSISAIPYLARGTEGLIFKLFAMEKQVKISFWLYHAKRNARRLTPIYMRVQYDYEFFTKTTGHYIKASMWDKKSMKVKGANAEVDAINDSLESKKIQVLMVVNKLILRNQPFNIHTIREHLEGKHQVRYTLMSVCNEYIRFMKKLEVKEYAKVTIIKYTNTKLRLQQYLKYRFKRNDIYLYELNFDFIQNWEVFLRNRFDNSTTTCYKHYQRFTRIVNWAIQKGYLDKYPFSDYRIRLPKKKVEYLTMDEITRIDETDYKVPRLNVISDIFVFCCYTGLPYTEVANLKPDNIIQGIDREPWLDITRQKTKKPYQVPLLPRALEILKKYENNPTCQKKRKLLPVPSNVKYNAYLKEIAHVCGIHKHLTTHLARKSFSVSLMLANGVNIGVLSKTLGHSSIQVTLDSYASIIDEMVLKDIRMIRKKFSN